MLFVVSVITGNIIVQNPIYAFSNEPIPVSCDLFEGSYDHDGLPIFYCGPESALAVVQIADINGSNTEKCITLEDSSSLCLEKRDGFIRTKVSYRNSKSYSVEVNIQNIVDALKGQEVETTVDAGSISQIIFPNRSEKYMCLTCCAGFGAPY